MATNLDTTYKVSKGNISPDISSQDYDEDPTHHGERNYLDAIELATIWMREGNKFVVVWDSGIGQTVTANENGVYLSNTSQNEIHWNEHKKIRKELAKVWRELHSATFQTEKLGIYEM